jgi:fatty-acyl-CoA synthase
VVANFARRFGLEVIDAYGATEGGVAVNREPDMPTGALGRAPAHVQIVDDDGVEKPRAILDHGRVLNAEACVGEIVNKQGVGPFEGYYNNPDATAKTTRNGWYWSGDLGYKDEDDYLYFAGRNADWIRVDGENFPAGPIEEALRGAPGVVLAAVYGVPDEQAGDQVMASLVISERAPFDPDAFAAWLDTHDAIGPKWRPTYVRVLSDPPTTGTNKIVKRALVHQKYRRDLVGDDELYVRGRGEASYRPLTAEDEQALYDAIVRSGRERFWDL